MENSNSKRKLVERFSLRVRSDHTRKPSTRLQKRVGVQSSSSRNFDFNGHEHRENKFNIGIDCEKVLEVGYTGLNTRACDLLIIKFKYNSANEADRYADHTRIVLHSDQALEIRDAGCAMSDETNYIVTH